MDEFDFYQGTHTGGEVDRDLDFVDGAFDESMFTISGDVQAVVPVVGMGSGLNPGTAGTRYVTNHAYVYGPSLPVDMPPDDALVTYGRARTEHKNAMDAAAQASVVKVTFHSVSSLPQTQTVPAGMAAYTHVIDDTYICIGSVFSNPAAITGDLTVTTSERSVTVSGTISGTTDIELYLVSPILGGFIS